MISTIGITNTFSRIICGYIADFPQVNSLFLNNICLVISTIAVAAVPFCTTFTHYMVMSIFFGIAIGNSADGDARGSSFDLAFVSAGYISLTSIILVDLLGLDKLTNAFGLVILFRGTAAIFGTPLAGIVYDKTGTFDYPFFMAAALFGLSAITSFLAPAFTR